MNKVYAVVIDGNYFYDGDEKVECGVDERHWTDSYWTDENDAIKEGDRLWNESEEGKYEKISVIEMKLGRGKGENIWDSNNERLVKSWC